MISTVRSWFSLGSCADLSTADFAVVWGYGNAGGNIYGRLQFGLVGSSFRILVPYDMARIIIQSIWRLVWLSNPRLVSFYFGLASRM